MKKRKLNLDKRAIARLSNESLENIQGGAEGWTTGCFQSIANCNCTNINTTTKKEGEDSAATFAGASCA